MLSCMVAFLAAAAAPVTPTPWSQPPDKVLTGPVMLARGTMRLPSDKQPATVELWMMSGKASPMGCLGDYIVCGRAALQVLRKGHPAVLTSLNELVGHGGICFDLGGWDLLFRDFNHDGTPDLALAEHTCRENKPYFLLTFSSSGEARRLPIEGDGVMWAPDLESDMSEIGMTEDGFVITLVDRSVDPPIACTSQYRWGPTVGRFSVTSEKGAAVVEPTSVSRR